MNLDLFKSGTKAQRFLGDVAVGELAESPWNPRKTRDPKRIAELTAHMLRAGYDVTRAVKVHRVDGALFVFAGATRRLAAIEAGIKSIPAFEFVGYSDEELWRLAYEDNESDAQHTKPPITDVWADYAARHAAGWTQQRIATALGVQQADVSRRIKWHTSIGSSARKAICDRTIEEGHLVAISGVICDVTYLASWLDSDRAQTELLDEVLSRHRGSTAGVPATVRVFRDAAARWTEMISEAEAAAESLEGVWRDRFVALLVESKARSNAAIVQASQKVKREIAEAAAVAAASANEAERKAAEDAQRNERIAAVLARVVCGDSREALSSAPHGISLLLTDPPYGMAFASGRRKATPKKTAIANDDDIGVAADLLAEVLAAARGRMMADGAVCVFTGWRYEPRMRDVIAAAGYELLNSIVMVKHNHGSGDLARAFAPKHERVLYATLGKRSLRKRLPDVLLAKDVQDSDHPTEKPIGILRDLIEATTDPGDLVVDPFCGSGSTLIAAAQTGRELWGCELDEGWHRKASDALLAQLNAKEAA